MTEEIKEMPHCIICDKKIRNDSQFINGNWYHNKCIENQQKENKILKENAEHNDKVVDKARWNEMIYKSRCEKANKLLKTIYKALPGTYNQLLIEIDNYLQGSDEK